ncbi:hypothetical protein COLO4_37013 [Corchorus olitorius]|uniref:Uncharacterized protein n=1 Tax=Corchorus olitorius TaxID=93759 RepID=A0A1R3G3W0_9ROSI|nr:hypothetical protein COLO4_37013 [Corchorus olitorius]
MEHLTLEAQQIVRICQAEMRLHYPNRHPRHSYAIRRRSVLRETIKLLIAMYWQKFDLRSKESLLAWLEFSNFEIPSAEEIPHKLRHNHIQHELYTRGLSNYLNPVLNVKQEIEQHERIEMSAGVPTINFIGDIERLILITTESNYGFRISLNFSIDHLTGRALHRLELVMDFLGNNFGGASCSTCGKSPTLSPSHPDIPTPTKILVYNATGVGNENFSEYLASHYFKEDPHLTVVTETRLSGTESRRARDNLIFEQSHSLDAAGYSGGLWLLWNNSDAEVEIIRKTAFDLHAEFRPVEREDSDA